MRCGSTRKQLLKPLDGTSTRAFRPGIHTALVSQSLVGLCFAFPSINQTACLPVFVAWRLCPVCAASCAAPEFIEKTAASCVCARYITTLSRSTNITVQRLCAAMAARATSRTTAREQQQRREQSARGPARIIYGAVCHVCIMRPLSLTLCRSETAPFALARPR